MELYNSQINRKVTVTDHIGAKMLKHNHVKNGGIYSTMKEIPEYFDLEAAPEPATGEVAATVAKKSATKTAKTKPVAKKAAPDRSLEGKSKQELVALAVKKLDIPEAQAKALKKDELIAALEK